MISMRVSILVFLAFNFVAVALCAPHHMGEPQDIVTSPTVSERSGPSADVSTQPTITTTTTTPETIRQDDDQTAGATELPEFTSGNDTSTFTCAGKINGYYADVKLGCRVYHFCTKIEGMDVATYQRMSYVCLEGSIFDQKDLNCVNKDELKVPCEKAEEEYERSNKQFDAKDESQPSLSDNLAANIMMNPIARFIAGR